MLTKDTEKFVIKSRKGDRQAQQMLFKSLNAPMMGVCLRYMKNEEDAEDVLMEGFFKVFENLNKFTYENERSFFGWVKRIMINEALMKLRRNKEIQFLAINEDLGAETDISPLDSLSIADLLKVIREIPVGYRTIFNLYEVEGFSHQDIADQLGISEGTSKSQLFKAKRMLREILNTRKYDYGS